MTARTSELAWRVVTGSEHSAQQELASIWLEVRRSAPSFFPQKRILVLDKWLAAILADERSAILAATDQDNRFFAYAFVFVNASGIVNGELGLLEECRGYGLGAAGLSLMLASATRLDAHRVEFEIMSHNQPAFELLHSANFTRAGTRVLEDSTGTPRIAVSMVCDLGSIR